jgi:hypothetical protein
MRPKSRESDLLDEYEADAENEPNVIDLVEETKIEYEGVKMNNENPIAPVTMRVHKLKEKIRQPNFEDRKKFKEMNLSHSLELA